MGSMHINGGMQINGDMQIGRLGETLGKMAKRIPTIGTV
jgi:hypothetical protein